ncbi:MAG: hypothetical protein ABIR08_07355 [Sphingomonas sp.]
MAQPFKAVFFDATCTLSNDNALSVNTSDASSWRAEPHRATVALPDGSTVPVKTVSFARASGPALFFVMSMPSVWRAGGIKNDALGLETMMVAVLLHESSHVSQFATYGAQVAGLAERNNLPQSFNDDSLQERFEGDPAFAGSIARETDLFFAAAAASDRATALRLAKEARGLMRARTTKYFSGTDAYFREAEDLWLTMEGSGQWAGYHWIIDPRGGGFPPTSHSPILPSVVSGGRRTKGWPFFSRWTGWRRSTGRVWCIAAGRTPC